MNYNRGLKDEMVQQLDHTLSGYFHGRKEHEFKRKMKELQLELSEAKRPTKKQIKEFIELKKIMFPSLISSSKSSKKIEELMKKCDKSDNKNKKN